MEIWAHRGKTAPENLGNNLNDFRVCADTRITGIETDIRLDSGKRVIIHHPGTKFRLLDLENFLDFLQECPDLECSLDLKQDSEELVDKAVCAVTRRNLEKRVYLTAFEKKISALGMESDARLLVYAKKLNPEIRTHIMAVFPFNLPLLADKYNPDAISFGWLQEPFLMKILSKNIFRTIAGFADIKAMIVNLKKRRIITWGGVVNNPKDMLYLADLGVDGIVTDDSKTLMSLVAQRKIP